MAHLLAGLCGAVRAALADGIAPAEIEFALVPDHIVAVHSTDHAANETLRAIDGVVRNNADIGLTFSASVPLYVHAEQELFALKTVANDPETRISRQSDFGRLADATLGLLLVNGECYTAWNARKSLVNAGYLDIHYDLGICAALLKKHKKSNHAWSHRCEPRY